VEINIFTIAYISIGIGIIITIMGVIFSKKNKSKILREIKREQMELDVPGFLSMVADQLTHANITTVIQNVMQSPVSLSNSVAKEIRKIYIKVFRPGKTNKLKDITDVVYYATLKKYPDSALLGLFYATINIAKLMDKEALPIIRNMERLAYSITKFIINIKKTMASTVNTINTINNLLIPVVNGIAVVMFTMIEAQIKNISSSMGAVSGFSVSSSSLGMGLKPLNIPPHWFAFILMLNAIATTMVTTKIKFQLQGTTEGYLMKQEMLKSVGRSLIFYGAIIWITGSMFIQFV